MFAHVPVTVIQEYTDWVRPLSLLQNLASSLWVAARARALARIGVRVHPHTRARRRQRKAAATICTCEVQLLVATCAGKGCKVSQCKRRIRRFTQATYGKQLCESVCLILLARHMKQMSPSTVHVSSCPSHHVRRPILRFRLLKSQLLRVRPLLRC